MPTNYCRHIRPNGTRCRSLALTGQPRCFWHQDLHQRHRTLYPAPGTFAAERFGPRLFGEPANPERDSMPIIPIQLDFPALEDRASIQLAISLLLGALAQNRIEPRRAATMLYGLQVAGSNVHGLPVNAPRLVRDTVLDEAGNPLALDEDPEEVIEHQLLLDEVEQEQLEEERLDYEEYGDEDTHIPEPRWVSPPTRS